MVYVYTGTHQQDNKKDFLLEYEIATNQWTHLMKGAPLGIGDRDSTCFIHERRFFIVTGLFSPLMSVHFYNIDTGTLTKGPNVPSPIKSTTPVMHGHKVMLFSPPDQKVFRYTLSREHLCITCYQVKNTPFFAGWTSMPVMILWPGRKFPLVRLPWTLGQVSLNWVAWFRWIPNDEWRAAGWQQDEEISPCRFLTILWIFTKCTFRKRHSPSAWNCGEPDLQRKIVLHSRDLCQIPWGTHGRIFLC